MPLGLFFSIVIGTCLLYRNPALWGISSNGRAPALHVGGTGIDNRILQLSFILLANMQVYMFFKGVFL